LELHGQVNWSTKRYLIVIFATVASDMLIVADLCSSIVAGLQFADP
jgi:hypothetical protein